MYGLDLNRIKIASFVEGQLGWPVGSLTEEQAIKVMEQISWSARRNEMPEGAELLHVGRMLIELDPVLAEYDFERDGFTLAQKGDSQTVTLKLTRDLARPEKSVDGEQAKDESHPGQMKLVPEEPGDEE